jgi:hypothetical protein
MIAKLEVLGDCVLALLVPRVQAAASTQACGPVPYLARLCPDGSTVVCYKTCCDNPGGPPSCAPVAAPPAPD